MADANGGAGRLLGSAHGTGRPEQGELDLEEFQGRLGGDLGEAGGVADGDRPGVVGLNAGEAFEFPVEPVPGVDQLLLDPREPGQMRLQFGDFGLQGLGFVGGAHGGMGG